MTAQRYIVVGAGGTGGYLIPGLARYLSTFHKGPDPEIWQLGILDGDEVETKNLDRQLFAADAVQMNKATAMARDYAHYKGSVIGIPEYLGRMNIVQYITEHSIVLICADNFAVRALIEDHVATLNNGIVINGGNELVSGSCQIYIRQGGKDLTPRLSFLHPELREPGPDRAEMTCQQVAALPGGEQTIAANMMSATWMLSGMMLIHDQLEKLNEGTDTKLWTELQFDLTPGRKYQVFGMDHRERAGWDAENLQ